MFSIHVKCKYPESTFFFFFYGLGILPFYHFQNCYMYFSFLLHQSSFICWISFCTYSFPQFLGFLSWKRLRTKTTTSTKNRIQQIVWTCRYDSALHRILTVHHLIDRQSCRDRYSGSIHIYTLPNL